MLKRDSLNGVVGIDEQVTWLVTCTMENW
jgi:hypothetical protein